MRADIADLDRNGIVTELTSRLTWAVEEHYCARSFEIKSDPATRTHHISWPRDNRFDSPRFLDYLHKLVHAWLAESIHPQFGEPSFARDTERGLVNTYLPVFEAATDWFVEAEIMRIAAPLAMVELREELHRVLDGLRRLGPAPTPAYWALSGLILAKGARTRGTGFLGQGMAKDVVDVFLQTRPDRPCLFTLQALTRGLLRATSPHDAFLAQDRGYERWRIALPRPRERAGSCLTLDAHGHDHELQPLWPDTGEND